MDDDDGGRSGGGGGARGGEVSVSKLDLAKPPCSGQISRCQRYNSSVVIKTEVQQLHPRVAMAMLVVLLVVAVVVVSLLLLLMGMVITLRLVADP